MTTSTRLPLRLRGLEQELDLLDGAPFTKYFPVIGRFRMLLADLHSAIRCAREQGKPADSPLHPSTWAYNVEHAEGTCQMALMQLADIQLQFARDLTAGRNSLYVCLHCCRRTIEHLERAGHKVEIGS